MQSAQPCVGRQGDKGDNQRNISRQAKRLNDRADPDELKRNIRHDGDQPVRATTISSPRLLKRARTRSAAVEWPPACASFHKRGMTRKING